MSVAGMMTPLRSAAYNNLQLNAGMFVVGAQALDMSSAKSMRDGVKSLLDEYVYYNESTAKEYSSGVVVSQYDSNCILGVTRGGGTFVVNSESRQAEADGVRYRFVGDTFIDSVDAQLTGTLIEVFPGNIKRILTSADIEHTANTHKWRISQRTRINKVTDYIRYLWWIGDLADGRLVAIRFKYAINTAGMNMTFTDKGEATMPFEFHAVQAKVDDYSKAPFEIYILDDDLTGIEATFDETSLTLLPEFSRDTLVYTVETGTISGNEELAFSFDDGVNLMFEIIKGTNVYAVDSSCVEETGDGFSLTLLTEGVTEGDDGVTALAVPFAVRVTTKNPKKRYLIDVVEEVEEEEEQGT